MRTHKVAGGLVEEKQEGASPGNTSQQVHSGGAEGPLRTLAEAQRSSRQRSRNRHSSGNQSSSWGQAGRELIGNTKGETNHRLVGPGGRFDVLISHTEQQSPCKRVWERGEPNLPKNTMSTTSGVISNTVTKPPSP